jgi:hypothetical protein
MKKLILVSLAAASTAVAQTETPQKIDVKALPQQATMIDDVVVPIPSEIFHVLDNQGSPKWSSVLRTTKESVKVPSEEPQIALQMGTVIAEGFIAVEAENVEEVKKIGANVLKLAKPLGVEKQVTARANAIISNANEKNWPQVRKELDGAMRDVKDAMRDLGSLPLSQLISLGGWLRGTEALTDVVGKSFSKDGAELLHQPVLLDYFDKRLTSMPPKYKKHPMVSDVQKGLLEIRPLIGIEDGSQISEKSLQEVGAVTARLVKAINSKGN